MGTKRITLLTKSGSQTILYVDNGTTDVTNTYKSAGGNTLERWLVYGYRLYGTCNVRIQGFGIEW